eukprot:Skav230588  [mRNA]  locus=scaffold3317:113267:119014:+ [translate_table: standard]
MIWALLWSIHLSTWHLQVFPQSEITFTYMFDAQVTGFQAGGTWRTHSDKQWQSIMRSCAHILHARHGFECTQFEYTPAHQGEFWNELADRLAKFAVTYPEDVPDCAAWWHLLGNADSELFQHVWMWEDMCRGNPNLPNIYGDYLCHITHPPPEATVKTFEVPTNDNKDSVGPDHLTPIRLKCASANVLTLLGGTKQKPMQNAGRQLVLMHQFDEAKYHIVAVQETRMKKQPPSNDMFHIIHAAADQQGHDGIQVWITKRQMLGKMKVLPEHLRIVHSTPNTLIVKMNHPACRLAIVATHAPHGDRPEHESQAHWDDIDQALSRCSDHDILFLGDVNGRVGSELSESIGGHQPDKETRTGHIFHRWLRTHSLFLPATYDSMHRGQAATYTTPNGLSEARIDFVALPNRPDITDICSYIDRNIDLTINREDHAAICCEFTMPHNTRSSQQPVGLTPLWDTHNLATVLTAPNGHATLHDMFSGIAWDVDVHSHAEQLASDAAHALSLMSPPTPRVWRKRHLQDETKELVTQKKHSFRCVKWAKHIKKVTLQKQHLVIWHIISRNRRKRDKSDAIPLAPIDAACRSWVRQWNQYQAVLQHQYKSLCTRTRQAILDDDRAFFAELAEQASRTYTNEGLTGLWMKIKYALPRQKTKRKQVPHDIDDELQCHFAQLEAGTIQKKDQFLNECLQRQMKQQENLPHERWLHLSELPRLFEIEAICLKQKPRRAPGLDKIPAEICKFGSCALAPHLQRLMMKTMLSASEPSQYKGGLLRTIYKKGPYNDPTSFRGILLANCFAKVQHSWSRGRALEVLQREQFCGQFGGLPSQQTNTGISIIKGFNRIGRVKHISTATIYLDIHAAFHHMLREWIFLVENPLLQHELSRIFNPDERDIPELAKSLAKACEEETMPFPSGLRQLLHDIHQSTFFVMNEQQDTVTHTRRGTRPGSPLADVGYNLLMARIMQQAYQKMQENPVYQEGMDRIGVATPPVIWVDDVAVPLATSRASDLQPLVEDMIRLLHSCFMHHGLTPNFHPGKTEVIMMHRGHQSDACRAKLFTGDTIPVVVTASEDYILSVRVVATYKHLGARQGMNADIDQEIKVRLAQARQAYEEMRRPIFKGNKLPTQVKLRLFQSLIMSRMLYGCGVWSDIPAAALHKLESSLVSYYRSIINDGWWNAACSTTAELLAHNQLPSFRVILAKHRLLYLRHLALHRKDFHWNLLVTEASHGTGWLCEVKEDLRWMSTVVVLPFDCQGHQMDWEGVLCAIAACKPWKAWVRRAVNRHTLQEKIANTTTKLHQDIIGELQTLNIDVQHEDETAEPDQFAFTCHHCQASFPTNQQLAVHQWRRHQIHAEESMYIQSSVCAGCLKEHWTTARVRQHLKYRANGCYDRIAGARAPDTPEVVLAPAHLKDVKRLPAQRLHSGPLRPTSTQRIRTSLRQQVRDLQQEGKDSYAWWWPPDHPAVTDPVMTALTAAVQQWLSQDEEVSEQSFHEVILTTLADQTMSHAQSSRIYVHWVEQHFADAIDGCTSVDHLHAAEVGHYSLLQELDCWKFRSRMESLMQQLRDLVDGPPREQMQHAGHCQNRDLCHKIASHYTAMQLDEERRQRWRILCQPHIDAKLRGRLFIAVHLYSGRRRTEDFQDHLQRLLPIPGIEVAVISIDTAISETMNIHSTDLWQPLVNAARCQRIGALLMGPPCESWSSARHQTLDAEDGTSGRRGPRPLRSATEPWGIQCLSIPELMQILIGTTLLLKGIFLLVLVAAYGGLTICEHPGIPFDETHASIWRTGLIKMLVRNGWFLKLCSIMQWRFGSPGVKPTALMYTGVQLPAILRRYELQGIQKPTQLLIGRNESGSFRTSAAKEYPGQLNAAFAGAAFEALQKFSLAPGKDEHQWDQAWLRNLISLCSTIDKDEWMPDYQPESRP